MVALAAVVIPVVADITKPAPNNYETSHRLHGDGSFFHQLIALRLINFSYAFE